MNIKDKIEFYWEYNRPALGILAVTCSMLASLMAWEKCKGPDVLDSNQYNNEKMVGEQDSSRIDSIDCDID